MRSSSPTAAMDMPNAIDPAVGSATMSTSGAKTHPSATRNRASSCVDTAGSTTARDTAHAGRLAQSPLDGAEHFVDFDLLEAHAAARALTQMMTLTGRIARHGDVVGRERAVPRRPRRTEDAAARHPARGGPGHRSRIARPAQHGSAAQRDAIRTPAL